MKNITQAKKRLTTITAYLFIAFLLLLLVLKVFVKSDSSTDQNSIEKGMNKETAFSFKKEGELSFLSKDEKITSTIDIELAEDEEAQTLGLMYRTHLEEFQGMLFIFNRADIHSFWMKNTVLPLDIIFINDKREIIKIHKNTVPYQESPGYSSGKPALYVVEVNAGYCDKFDVKEGDKISYLKY
jgi:uncharacterized membrane protein (UPF0127 family)/preprotein translocase subunit SecG